MFFFEYPIHYLSVFFFVSVIFFGCLFFILQNYFALIFLLFDFNPMVVYKIRFPTAFTRNICMLVSRAVVHVLVLPPEITTSASSLQRSVLTWQSLEMELLLASPARIELRSVIRFLCTKNTTSDDIHPQLYKVYGKKCISIQHVCKWYREFKKGRTADQYRTAFWTAIGFRRNY